MTTLNLDQKAAHYAQKIVKEGCKEVNNDAKKVENLVTKTLGVLQEQGVYACILFLLSRTGDEAKIAPKLSIELYNLLNEVPELSVSLTGQSNPQQVLQTYSDQICENLDTLLFVRDLYEQTLIYARYGAKAAKADTNGTKMQEGS
ncbi:MAG TPA: hypothetical protein PKE64_27140 [Anaerolineae bacterium]|nr:hypothetical protein [Anaerolineae bacterium]